MVMVNPSLDGLIIDERTENTMCFPGSIKPLQENGFIPNADQFAQRETALEASNQTLFGESYTKLHGTVPLASTSTVQGVTYVCVPINGYGIGIWTAEDAITCCVAGTPTEKTFFAYAKYCFRRAGYITIEQTDKWGLNMFKLYLKGIHIRIQYHQSPFVNHWAQDVDQNEYPGLVYNMSRQAEKRYAGYKKTLQLARVFNNQFAKDFCYAALAWATYRGLVSREFGLLDRDDIPVIVAIALDRMPSEADRNLSQFMMEFCRLPIGDKLQHSEHESLVLDPGDISPTMKDILVPEFFNLKIWYDQPRHGELEVLQPSFRSFTQTSAMFLKVGVTHWGHSNLANGRFFDRIHQRLAEFSHTLAKNQYPGVIVRPWPYRLIENIPDSERGEAFHEACYFIGLTIKNKEFHRDTLDGISGGCEKNIVGDERFDSSKAFVHASLVETIEANHWIPDRKDWGPVPEEAESDDSDEAESDSQSDTISLPSRSRRGKPGKAHGRVREQDVASKQPTRPLRPALDVLHRIRHDTALDSSDYTVGYLDRFTGIKELPLDKWDGGEASSESFIPQSRILYFLRKSDGVRIWDRESRLDLLFGSGKESKHDAI